MRQGQQNRRGRGRNNNMNNQRKGQNPLTRSFESNGPDVKLRGTPAHIAEKYLSLARDAHSSGDPVLAENYLQHAEHYNRIIMTFRDQQSGQGSEAGHGGNPGVNGHGGRFDQVPSGDMDGGEDGEDMGADQVAVSRSGGAEQPRVPEAGFNRYEDRPQRPHAERQHQNPQRDRSFQEGRGGFSDRRDRQERFERPERDRSDRDRPDRDRPDRDRPDRDRPDRDRPDRDRLDRDRQPVSPVVEARSEVPVPRRRERPAGERLPQDVHEQPAFLRRPVRRPRRDDQEELVEAPSAAIQVVPEDSGHD